MLHKEPCTGGSFFKTTKIMMELLETAIQKIKEANPKHDTKIIAAGYNANIFKCVIEVNKIVCAGHGKTINDCCASVLSSIPAANAMRVIAAELANNPPRKYDDYDCDDNCDNSKDCDDCDNCDDSKEEYANYTNFI